MKWTIAHTATIVVAVVITTPVLVVLFCII